MKSKFFNPQETPILRPANKSDMKGMHTIWQQKHILPFMSFEELSLEDFEPIFNNFYTSNKLYVIETNDKVVAVRRLVYGTGSNAHCVSFCSLGVHEDHLGKGYGSMFYDKLIDMIKEDHPHIKRIELSQETDNPSIAGTLAEKKGFKIFAVFGEWQPRLTGQVEYTNKWMAAEKFLELILDPSLESKKSTTFDPALPQLLVTNPPKFDIETKDHIKNCWVSKQLMASCTMDDGVRRFAHIQFWSVKIESNCNLQIAEQFLRELALESKKSFKKIEIYSHDPRTIKIMEQLGFHCRGERTASCLIGEDYFNETGAELSFFNIDNAFEVLNHSKKQTEPAFINLLATCKSTIKADLLTHKVDNYGKAYLENLVFQMVREVHSEALYEQGAEPWGRLIFEIPSNLACKEHLENLAMQLAFSNMQSSNPNCRK